MIRPTDVHPVTDFKRNTPSFVRRLRRTGQPEVLTIDGRGEIVVQSAAAYQKLLDLLAALDPGVAVRRALADAESGRHVSLDEFAARMRKRLEAPRDG